MGKKIIAVVVEDGIKVEKEIEVVLSGEKSLWDAARDVLSMGASAVTISKLFHKDENGNKGDEIR